MHRLQFKDKQYEISERNFLHYLRHYVDGDLNWAEAYDKLHQSGFSDWLGTLTLDVGQYELEKVFMDQIEDTELSEAFRRMKDQLQEMIDLDENMTRWLTGYVGLSFDKDQNVVSRTRRRLNKILNHGPDGNGPQGPVWALHPEFVAMVKLSEGISQRIRETKKQIERRIELLETAASE